MKEREREREREREKKKKQQTIHLPYYFIKSEIVLIGESAGGELAGYVSHYSKEANLRQPDKVILAYAAVRTKTNIIRKKKT